MDRSADRDNAVASSPRAGAEPGRCGFPCNGKMRKIYIECASARITLAREAFEISPEADIAQTLVGAAIDVLGAAPEWVGEPFWMDSAILSAAGIPTVIFGPTGTGAHAVEEWVDLESVGQRADVLLNTAARFCA